MGVGVGWGYYKGELCRGVTCSATTASSLAHTSLCRFICAWVRVAARVIS